MERIEVDISGQGKASDKVVTGQTLRDVIEKTVSDPKNAKVIHESQALIDQSKEIDASPNEVAETLLLEALEIRLKTFGKDSREIIDNLGKLGNFYLSQKHDLGHAQLCLEKEMFISEKLGDEDGQREIAKNLNTLYGTQANRLMDKGGKANMAAAEDILEKNLSLLRQKRVPYGLTIGAALNLARVYLWEAKKDQAFQTYDLIVNKLHSKEEQAAPAIYKEYIDQLIGDHRLELAEKLAGKQLKYYRTWHSDDADNIKAFSEKFDQIRALRLAPATGAEGMDGYLNIKPDNSAGKHQIHFNTPPSRHIKPQASTNTGKDNLKPEALKRANKAQTQDSNAR